MFCIWFVFVSVATEGMITQQSLSLTESKYEAYNLIIKQFNLVKKQRSIRQRINGLLRNGLDVIRLELEQSNVKVLTVEN